MSQASNLRHQLGQGFPRINAPAVDPKTGIFTSVWFAFLQSLWQESKGSSALIQEQVLTGSPWTFTSPQEGTLLVQGGNVTDAQFTRDAISYYSLGQFNGPVTIGDGDMIVLTYTAPPKVVFIPI